MATSSYIPTITRKKRVPSKYNPNTYRVVAYDENDEPTKYPEVSSDLREVDPLGVHVNNRPDMLFHSSKVLPYDLTDYRINKPQSKKCCFLRQNSRTLNEPVCFVYTKFQPIGHWIAPQLPPLRKTSPTYKSDTVFRKDFCGNKNEMYVTCTMSHGANVIQNTALNSFHVNNLQEKDVNVNEKISYEHCYDSRNDPNYPLRGKRQGSFVWTKCLPSATKNWSYLANYRTNVNNCESD